MKEYELAITDLDKASSIKPTHAACHEYLAETYSFTGQNELAEKHLRIAKELRGEI
jgi:Tfp pilus assembly protein PilF